jgi:LmbE family N-acetylglucosaminyl deacetylase
MMESNMMNNSFRLMAVLAHPDDESLGMGGILAKYAAERVETYLVTATRGERGWFGDERDYPGPEALGRIRQAELLAAADVLGLRKVTFLDYLDGELDQVDPAEAIAKIVTDIRRVRPQVVITFDPNGVYGHPDHIAISQFTTAAIVAAADPSYHGVGGKLPPHRVSKLYYRTFARAEQLAYEAAFGELVMTIDGVNRRTAAWPDWAITTRIDTAAYWPQVWQAVACHQTQLPGYQALKELPDEYHHALWGAQTYYRAFSLVNGGRAVEADLFAGLRETTTPLFIELPIFATP